MSALIVACWMTACQGRVHYGSPDPGLEDTAGSADMTTDPVGSNDPAGPSPVDPTPAAPNPADPTPAAPISSGSSGCGDSTATLGVQEKSIEVDGQTREYLLVVPEGFVRGEAHALVIAWHCYGMDSAWMRRLVGGIESQAGNRAIYVYPQSQGKSWNAAPEGSDAHFFDALVQAMGRDYCLDTNQIFSIGFSNGGYFVNALAQRRAKILRAFVAVAGGGGGGPSPVAALIIHGREDTWVDFSEGNGSREAWRIANHCGQNTVSTDLSPCVRYGGCRDGYPVQWCPWDGDHDFPTFGPAAVWSFFSGLGPRPSQLR